MRQVLKESEVQHDEAVIKQTEEEDFLVCKEINDKWNEEVAKIREVRLANMRENRKNNVLKRLLKEEKFKEHKKSYIDEQIKKAKEEAPTFITAENIDAAIEECLANTVDHNRALDLEGNWYEGKYPPVPPSEETQKKPSIVEN